jgi:hypothetical protein
MNYVISFKDCLERAERINWRVDELIGPDKRLDFSRPFMPESLARTGGMRFLTPGERLTLNQIRGHAYLAIFGLVEEFILPFLMDHARPEVAGDSYRSRAFLEFAAEEAKHIHLFRTFREAFAEVFTVRCEVIGPPETIATHVLSHHRLAVALLISQLEWMSQRHFTESIQEEETLDPRFKDLLLHHWMEERQHAQLDSLIVEELAATCGPEEIATAFDDYHKLIAFLDEGLKQQAVFDLAALERGCGRTLSVDDRQRFMAVQHQANRWTYLGSGMTHPNFQETAHRLDPAAAAEICSMALTFA